MNENCCGHGIYGTCSYCMQEEGWRKDRQLAQQAELLLDVKERIEEISRIACGEDQVAMDDTEGMNHIYYKAKAIEKALEKVK